MIILYYQNTFVVSLQIGRQDALAPKEVPFLIYTVEETLQMIEILMEQNERKALVMTNEDISSCKQELIVKFLKGTLMFLLLITYTHVYNPF